MLGRFLYPDGPRVHVRRLTLVLAATIAPAIFGSYLLAITPMLSSHQGLQTLWVLFAVGMLKLPLVGLLWWFILRNDEWPMRPPKWSDQETREILAYLLREADRVRELPDAPARLAYLRGEAWNVADRVSGDVKMDAVAVAVRIDGLTARPARPRRTA